MPDAADDPVKDLGRVGAALWHVNFCADYISDMSTRVPEGADPDLWEETVAEDSDMLRGALKDLKQALCDLPEPVARLIANGYATENDTALARNDATILLANAVRVVGARPRKG